jgi:hypothetical protein
MQKLNSVTVKKNEMVLNFVSDLARQTVPVVIDLDNNIAVNVYTESDSISTTADNVNIEYDVILNDNDLDVIN